MASVAVFIADPKQSGERPEHENVALREEIDRASMFEGIVGTSAALRRVLSLVSKVAPTDATVMVTGETGTGKELVARAIHRRSRRSSRAFLSVNCAAIPRDLIASEFFGHEKGSFTGVLQRRLGRFELAHGGTIYLDEVGELPVETQIALLRVLQEHEFERVGGTRSIETNVRVIAATNRNLPAAIADGNFRSDLSYRLNVFPIEMPALRERREDIPALVGSSKTARFLCALRTMRPRHAVILTLSGDGDCPLWSYLQSGTLPWLISFICHSYVNCRVCTQNSQSGTLCCAFANLIPYSYSYAPPRKSFSCNTYGSPRKCCKQKTYSVTKPFRCNTYKKQGARGLWLTRFASRIAVLGNPRRQRTYLNFSLFSHSVSPWQSCFKAPSTGAATISRTRSRSTGTSSFLKPLVSMVSCRRTVIFAGQSIQWPVR